MSKLKSNEKTHEKPESSKKSISNDKTVDPEKSEYLNSTTGAFLEQVNYLLSPLTGRHFATGSLFSSSEVHRRVFEAPWEAKTASICDIQCIPEPITNAAIERVKERSESLKVLCDCINSEESDNK